MEETINKTASSVEDVVIIDEESFNTLRGMLRSSDKDDWTMAQMILTKCNVEKSIYYIWLLSRKCYVHNMVNLRTKAGRKFRDDTNLFSLCGYNEEILLKYLVNKDWVTKEIFQKLIPEITKSVNSRTFNQFFDVSLTLKDDYKKYTDETI